ncbi:hypothetical protein C4D60_Mb06t16840 [Musa balbisiana]|uniref:Uncharacterized protein n=1 Tax=Musa balbisiana TaxID=52838 RepID=A0A4S8INK2_MUSBA|nr:hypothetical protein C4D60_Mb06t16840 [Musa balbisiana]
MNFKLNNHRVERLFYSLRGPADRYALRSAAYSPSLHLLLSPPSRCPATAPRFSMRVASKQAYICRDCGFPFLLSVASVVSITLMANTLVCFGAFHDNVLAAISTMTGRHLRSCLVSTSVPVSSTFSSAHSISACKRKRSSIIKPSSIIIKMLAQGIFYHLQFVVPLKEDSGLTNQRSQER